MEEETNVAASAEVSANEPMSFDSALSILNQADEAPVEEQTAAPEQAEAEETGDEADKAEAPEQQETDAAPDADTDADEPYAHGNARTRLRDGTVTTVGELKKAAEQAKEYQRQLQERETRDREFEQRQAQIAAQEQFFTNTVNQAKAILQANIPPLPDEKLIEQGDSFTYMEQKARRDAWELKWRQLDHAQKVQAQQADQKRQDEIKQRVAQELQLLKDAVPETRTDEGFKAFRDEILTHAPKEYGFSAEEITNLGDHRALRVLKDAIAYRKLQADKAKAMEKAKAAPPVQQTAQVQAPGRRVSPAEKQAQTVKSGFETLRKTGSFDDALRILNSME
jgi:hypothetical protein